MSPRLPPRRSDRDGELRHPGGHVEIGDWATLGGLSAVHQHTKVGAYCFIAHNAAVTAMFRLTSWRSDGPPCRTASTRWDYSAGLYARASPKHSPRLPIAVPLGTEIEAAIEELETLAVIQAELRPFIEFIKRSERSIVR